MTSDKVDSIKDMLTDTCYCTKSFCLSKKLDINVGKTQFIFFKSPSKKLPEDTALELDAQSFKVLSQVKLLGVTFDKHLTLKDYIFQTVITCNGLLGVLRRISGALPKLLGTLFYSAIVVNARNLLVAF